MAITFFVNNAAGFTTAATGLNFTGTETFEESNLPDGNLINLTDPLGLGRIHGSHGPHRRRHRRPRLNPRFETILAAFR
jgi:hypothetical protein